MDTEKTRAHLKRSINSIIEDYEIFDAILGRHADRETARRFLDRFAGDPAAFDIQDEDLADMDSSSDAQDAVCGALESVAMEAMQDYPLSIDDSHIWFTIGGPNISANVTGWRVIVEDGRRRSVHVQDIELKGRWGGASVDVDLTPRDAAFEHIADMFEMNLLQKFGAY